MVLCHGWPPLLDRLESKGLVTSDRQRSGFCLTVPAISSQEVRQRPASRTWLTSCIRESPGCWFLHPPNLTRSTPVRPKKVRAVLDEMTVANPRKKAK